MCCGIAAVTTSRVRIPPIVAVTRVIAITCIIKVNIVISGMAVASGTLIFYINSLPTDRNEMARTFTILAEHIVIIK